LVSDLNFKYSDDGVHDIMEFEKSGDHYVMVSRTPELKDSPAPYSIANLLNNKSGNCATLPVVYVLICERLNLPVSLVTIDDHQFCRYDDGKTKINIETTNPKAMGVGTPDSAYLRDFKYEPMELEKSTTMKTQNYHQMVSSLYVTKAAYLTKSGKSNLNEPLAMSLLFDPQSIYSIMNMKSMLSSLGEEGKEELKREIGNLAVEAGLLPPPKDPEVHKLEMMVSETFGQYRKVQSMLSALQNYKGPKSYADIPNFNSNHAKFYNVESELLKKASKGNEEGFQATLELEKLRQKRLSAQQDLMNKQQQKMEYESNKRKLINLIDSIDRVFLHKDNMRRLIARKLCKIVFRAFYHKGLKLTISNLM